MTTFDMDESEYLEHYGILRKSGRYPWGSGEDSAQRSKTFFSEVGKLRKEGMSESEIAKGFGMTTTELRATTSIAKTEKKLADISMAQRLKDKGMANTAIGERMGINESSVRSLLQPGQKDKLDVLQATSGMLKDLVDKSSKSGYIDIGSGQEVHLGVSADKMKVAVSILKEQGYQVHNVQTDQLGTGAGKKTVIRVLAPPGTTYKDIVTNQADIEHVRAFSQDGGLTFDKIQRPMTISSQRVGVKYGNEGGSQADGVIYVRPGVHDVSLGGSRYAQVRIAVDGTHYLKGMAMYKDDLPPGVDLLFNTNKNNTGNKLDAMKKVEADPDNPFGSQIRRQVVDPQTKKLTSVMNKVYEEGDWDTWSRSLSSQMLSKQSTKLAQQQLDMTFERKKAELDSIMALTNPAIRKKLLETYATSADSSSVRLKAASLPRQSSHAILPIQSMKETEVYAPNFRQGERVVLIRHPHGGPFEIPELVVNNNQPEAKKLLGRAPDAIGISHKVAERLSGADFDGDTVIVIPNEHGHIKTQPALEGLKDFDPKRTYPMPEGTEFKGNKQRMMGDVSNLITDMSIKGATSAELARAVRHSMVVIDSEKHNLNYKQSAIDNGIGQLKAKYQGKTNAGASTLISKASSRADVPARKPRAAKDGGPVDRKTGEKVFEPTNESWVDSKGKTIVKTQRSTKMAEAKDALTLSSGTVMEKVYGDHANRLKDLANQARREAVNTKPLAYSPSAKKAFSNEVATLDAKLQLAIHNRPLERQAQLIAAANVALRRQSQPNMDDDQLKKVKYQSLNDARERTGAKKQQIEITDDEWRAIQAGAITNHKLTEILNNSNIDRVKELATPRTKVLMTGTKKARAQAMLASGYTQAEVADHLGVSLTTLKTSLGGEG